MIAWIVVGTTAAAAGPASGDGECTAASLRTLFSNDVGVIQKKPSTGAVFVCRKATGKRVRLGDPESEEVLPPFAIAGHYVAYRDRPVGPDVYHDNLIQVLDYEANTLRHEFTLNTSDELDRGVDRLLLKRSGRVAWLDCGPVTSRGTCGTESSPYFGKLERRVLRDGKVLDSSTAIRLGSLRVAESGRAITWLHGHRLHRARF